MANGFAALGDMLAGGGNLDRQLALQNATQTAGYRSAQTENALAGARKAQSEAMLQEQEKAFKERVATAQAQQLLGDDLMGTMVAGGMGGDFSSYSAGRKANQEVDFRTRAADVATTPEQRQRLLQALEGKPSSDLAMMGAGNFTDMTDPTKTVETTSLGDSLIGENEAQAALANAQATNPAAFRSAAKTPEQIFAESQARASGTTMGKGMTQRTLDLPSAKLRLASTDSKFDRMTTAAGKVAGNEALWSAVGVGRPLSTIPGTEAAYLRAQLNTIKAQVGFAVLQDMRESSKTGGALGNVSDRENTYLQNAIASLDENLNPEDIREQLGVLVEFANGSKQRLHDAFMETYPELGGAAPAAGAQPAVPGTAPAAVEEWVRGPDGKLQRAR